MVETPPIDPHSPLTDLPEIGPKRAAQLAALGLETIGDLLVHLPRRYEDRRAFKPIASLQEGETATIRATVVRAVQRRLRGRLTVCEATFRDNSGTIRATWFGRGFLARTFTEGSEVVLTGTVANQAGRHLRNPEYEIIENTSDVLHTGRIVPVYGLADGLNQRHMRRWIYTALESAAAQIADPLPLTLRTRYRYPPLACALRDVHFPEHEQAAWKARERFAYEELLAIQLGVLQARQSRAAGPDGIAHTINRTQLAAFRAALPFTLTKGQQRAVRDILRDMAATRPMARLLQGDVGCGKTVVAAHAVVAAEAGGYQTAIMAPTEVLAEQHARSFRQLLAPLGIAVALLTGSVRDRRTVRRRLAEGGCAVVVGTHALFQRATTFRRLGLVIVDEQHRFGVEQRARLAAKGESPDVLHMTATPIPRSVALTLYGSMDLSVIPDRPPGRRPVITRKLPHEKLQGLYDWLCREAEAGRQAYIICPLVEASDTRALKAVVDHYEDLAHGALAPARTALVHGRMAGPDKDTAVDRFRRGEIDILFGTTVVEVGIDAPNATAIVIEDAGQFGLTQLHQLRGRVGRGTAQAYCFLLGEPKTREARERIETFCRCADGFEVAEADFALRGPGEVLGLRQAGLSDLRAADLVRDARLLDRARRDAERLLRADPTLAAPELASLARTAAHYRGVLA